MPASKACKRNLIFVGYSALLYAKMGARYLLAISLILGISMVCLGDDDNAENSDSESALHNHDDNDHDQDDDEHVHDGDIDAGREDVYADDYAGEGGLTGMEGFDTYEPSMMPPGDFEQLETEENGGDWDFDDSAFEEGLEKKMAEMGNPFESAGGFDASELPDLSSLDLGGEEEESQEEEAEGQGQRRPQGTRLPLHLDCAEQKVPSMKKTKEMVRRGQGSLVAG